MAKQIDRYLDGDLSDEATTDLFTWVGEDGSNAELFAKHAMLDQHTQELLEDGLFQRDQDHVSVPTRSSRLNWRIVAAVALLLVVAVGWIISPMLFESDQPHLAMIAQSVGGYNNHGDAFRPGAGLDAGTLEVSRGLVRVDFSSGAQIAIEGPASLEIRSDMHIVVNRGIVTAIVPEAAIGFVIETEAARVVDLGTAFGISVDEDGQTDVCVFEGEVEVNHRTNSSESRPRRVTEGQAVRANRISPTIDVVDFETSPFENAWPISSGVLQTTGVMKFVSPGPGLVPGHYEDNDHIIVFPERRRVQLGAPVEVDLVEPGEYRRFKHAEACYVQPGQSVRSYLLQFDPLGRLEKHDPAKPQVIGQITFDSPILGLIVSSGKLLETDGLLGDPNADYGKLVRRGIEAPRKDQAGKPGRDILVLAADRRTLILNFSAGSAVDQIRVLVETE
jgi:ferric-dicitrate binding protein FerR (iron transport regulator)